LIFYSSKEAVIFSGYKALILSSISSRMAATSLLGASFPSPTRQPNRLTPLQRDHNALGWTGWVFADIILNHFYLHLSSKRVFPRACPVYFRSVQLTYLSLLHPLRFVVCPMLVPHQGLLEFLSRTTFATHHLSLPRRCRADLIHGCISPCIIRKWHTLMRCPMTRAGLWLPDRPYQF
jgi:hypothetical protein